MSYSQLYDLIQREPQEHLALEPFKEFWGYERQKKTTNHQRIWMNTWKRESSFYRGWNGFSQLVRDYRRSSKSYPIRMEKCFQWWQVCFFVYFSFSCHGELGRESGRDCSKNTPGSLGHDRGSERWYGRRERPTSLISESKSRALIQNCSPFKRCWGRAYEKLIKSLPQTPLKGPWVGDISWGLIGNSPVMR